MIVNYERLTKNITQFVIDFFKNKEIEIVNKLNSIETFESYSNNLKSKDFELFYNSNQMLEKIIYSFDNKLITKKITYDDINVVLISLSGDLPTNLEFKKNKKIVRKDEKIIKVKYFN